MRGESRVCRCHGEPMERHSHDGAWRCKVRRREAMRRRQADGRWAAGYARQLARGEQIGAHTHHHAGMAMLKAQMGDPRPPGLTLSLANFDSPSAYWGWSSNTKAPYRLSTDPADYIWETQAENLARRSPTHERTGATC